MIQFIIPVRNGEWVIEKTLLHLADYCAANPGAEIIVVENQSTDGTREILSRFAHEHAQVPVLFLHAAKCGLGLAYRMGIRAALQRNTGATLLLSAADLPFGFSDVQAFRRLEIPPPVAIGSKANPHSIVSRPLSRSIASMLFRKIRGLLLGMKTADTQGTVFLSPSAARALVGNVQSDDFLFSTELIYCAEKMGMSVVELPVVLKTGKHPSSVRLVQDGYRFLKQTWSLRTRVIRVGT